jgi:hypothetical protein
MQTAILPPTADRVRAACDTFDRDHQLTEQTLQELFHHYPSNSDSRHILLKVVAINGLYHTCIFALDTVARHIHAHHKEIDFALAAGSPEIVDKIARVTVKGKVYNFFSFATKFCSWHNPAAYPIYDAHVDHYLWNLQNQDHFASFLHPETHGLTAYSFKEIDKFLYLEGTPPKSSAPDPEPCGPGAFDYYPSEEAVS